MPRPCEPGVSFPLVLDGDLAQPAESRPTFMFRTVSARRLLEAKRNQLANPGSALEEIEKFLKDAIVGWQHLVDPESGQPIPFDAQELDRWCDELELVELFGGYQLRGLDKKKLESPP